MSKMTDEQIINALKKYIECAENTQIARDVGGTLVISLLQNALDQVIEQQSEIEKLKAGIEEEHSISQAYSDLCDYKQKEIEKLKEKYDRTIHALKAVLNERVDHTEAIKECLDKLKSHWRFKGGVVPCNEIHEIIDETYKEMVGEDNG